MEAQPVCYGTMITVDGDNLWCGICFDEYDPADMVLAECNHNYCRECLRTQWHYRINDGNVLSLKCIEPTCNKEVSEEQVLELLDDEMGEKFIQFRRSRQIQRDHGVVIDCTSPNCDGFATGSRWRPKALCRTCSFAYCWTCKEPWHGWFSRCKKDKNVEKLYKSFKRSKDIQSCPKCKAQIWKNAGCKHMTCKMCKHQYCWHCNRNWPCSGSLPGAIWCLYNAVLLCPSCPCSEMVNRNLIAFCFFLTIVPFIALIFSSVLIWLSLWCAVMCTCLWVANSDLIDPRDCCEIFAEGIYGCIRNYCCCCCR